MLDVDEPRGDGNSARVTMPAFAAAVSIMSYAGLCRLVCTADDADDSGDDDNDDDDENDSD